jgi:hypothetical protein
METISDQDPSVVEKWIQLLSGNYNGIKDSTEIYNSTTKRDGAHQTQPQDVEDQPEGQNQPFSNDPGPSSSNQQKEIQTISRKIIPQDPGKEITSKNPCKPECSDEGRELNQISDSHQGFILLGFKIGKNKVLLEHSNQQKVLYDKDMFEQLRSEYRKKRWRYWIRLMNLDKIEFKKVSRYCQ